jgi:hypothetical protein
MNSIKTSKGFLKFTAISNILLPKANFLAANATIIIFRSDKKCNVQQFNQLAHISGSTPWQFSYQSQFSKPQLIA